MTAYTQQQDWTAEAQQTTRIQPARIVATVAGLALAVILFVLSYPLLVTAGLWLMGLALIFILYGLTAHLWQGTPQWGLAIAGQVVGIIGLSLVFIASLLG